MCLNFKLLQRGFKQTLVCVFFLICFFLLCHFKEKMTNEVCLNIPNDTSLPPYSTESHLVTTTPPTESNPPRQSAEEVKRQ